MAHSENLVELLHLAKRGPGVLASRKVCSCLGWRLKDSCSQWQVAHTNSCFTRRVTCLRWHPQNRETVAYGTHAGDIVLWNYNKPATECPKIEGLGMGYGCITDMRFHPHLSHLIYTTAVVGKFSLQDFEGKQTQVLHEVDTPDYWWCSLDYSVAHNVLVAGDNHGNAVLMDMTNHTTFSFPRLHKNKIKHMEFCPARSWMLVTASCDRTVKFWDIRMLRSPAGSKKPIPLSIAGHAGVVSSAYFDPTHGTRLLTTAQNGEIRVYEPHNLWKEPMCVIGHAHRNFQHMTDIKATWHPLYPDLCVVGRYPGKDDIDKMRTVDIIDLETGEVCAQFHSPHFSGIIQLNQFSRSGDCLASAMGYNGLIWTPAEVERKTPEVQNSVDFGVVLGSVKTSRCNTKRKSLQGKQSIARKKVKTVIRYNVKTK